MNRTTSRKREPLFHDRGGLLRLFSALLLTLLAASSSAYDEYTTVATVEAVVGEVHYQKLNSSVWVEIPHTSQTTGNGTTCHWKSATRNPHHAQRALQPKKKWLTDFVPGKANRSMP